MTEDEKKKRQEQIKREQIELAGEQTANVSGQNARLAMNAAADDMELLKWKAGRLSNVNFDQAKGNLFEYIEYAKLHRNSENAGYSFDKPAVTDISESLGGFGEHTAPDDFRLVRDGEILDRGQAKVNNNPRNAAKNFVNPKYHDMQRICPVDEVEEVQKCLEDMYQQGTISAESYENAVNNLSKKGLYDPETGITSGGTTTDEIFSFKGENGKISQKKIQEYVHSFESDQFKYMAKDAGINGMVVGGLFTGVVSAVENTVKVFKNEESMKEAIQDVGKKTVKAGIKGGAVGVTSASLNYVGIKTGSKLLNNSSATTMMAGGLIDCGVDLLEYAKGEITTEQLKQNLQDNTVRTVTTVYFGQAIAAVVPLGFLASYVVYSVSGIVVSNIQAIFKEADLKIAEYRRLKGIYEEFSREMEVYRQSLEKQLAMRGQRRRENMTEVLDLFDAGLADTSDIQSVIHNLVALGEEIGIDYQYADFDEFSEMMCSDDMIML